MDERRNIEITMISPHRKVTDFERNELEMGKHLQSIS
jgi:hypothetical protein